MASHITRLSQGATNGTASQSFQTRAESGQAADRHLEFAVLAYRRGYPGELRIRLGAARYRAFAERAADGAAAVARNAGRHREPGRARRMERHGDDQAVSRHRRAV